MLKLLVGSALTKSLTCQEMLPPAQDLSHAGMQAEHMAGVNQQHHHLAQQHALGHHDPSLLAAHHQALAAAHDPSQHLSAEAIDTTHAEYAAQVLHLFTDAMHESLCARDSSVQSHRQA